MRNSNQNYKELLTLTVFFFFFFCFQKNGNCWNKYIVLGYLDPYIIKDDSDVHTKYSEDDVIRMKELLILILIWSSMGGKCFNR